MECRLFVDMDGTLAEYKYVSIEEFYKKGFFLSLRPNQNVLDGIKYLSRHAGNIKLYILSSVFTDSEYSVYEKNAWVDKYLPEIPKEQRIFSPCGENKANYIPGGVETSDFLLDDFSPNLFGFEEKFGKGIKCRTQMNGTKGTWKGNCIHALDAPEKIAKDIQNFLFNN